MKNLRPDFEKAQLTATQLLIRQNINSLKIDVRNFVFDISIIIDSIQNYCKVTRTSKSEFTYDGFNGAYVLTLKSGKHLILYDEDDTNPHHQHWGIAHELGHIYLEHNCDGEKEEIEANYFAAQLLMPEIAIRYALKLKGRFTANDIFQYFNVSHTAASKRIKTLNNKKIFYHEEDRLLFKKISPIVEKNFLHFNLIKNNTHKEYPLDQII